MLSPLKGAALAFAPGRTPDLTNVEGDVLQRWERVQQRFGKDLGIKSGFRDPTRNANAGGAKKSQHMHGKALDIDVRDLSIAERKRLIEAASAEGFTGIGVYNNSLHFDTGPRRYWGPSYRSKSLPGWASGTIKAHMAGLYEDTKVADAGGKSAYFKENFLTEKKEPASEAVPSGGSSYFREQFLKEDAAKTAVEPTVETAAPEPPAATAADRGMVVEPTDMLRFTPPGMALAEIKKYLPPDLQNALDNIVAGSSLGTSDEMVGVANAPFMQKEGESLDDARYRAQGIERERQGEFKEKSPALAIGSEIAGGFALAPVGGAVLGTGKTLGGQVVRGIGEGALFGAGYGAGTADDKRSRLRGAAEGAALGAVTGAVFPPAARVVGWAAKKLGAPVARMFGQKRYYVEGKGITEEGRKALRTLGYNPDEIADDIAKQFSERAAKMGDVPAGKALALEEQGIPAMLQNITKNTDDWHFIEQARKGVHGNKVANLINGMLDEQAKATGKRATELSRGLRPEGGADEPSRLAAAEMVTKGLLKRRAELKSPADAAYKALGFTTADGRAAKYLPKVFNAVLKSGDDSTGPIAALGADTPLANRAMKWAESIAKRAETDGIIPGKEIDRLRQFLNKSASGSTNDIDALRLMRKGFNEWLNSAVEAGVIYGDDAAIASLKEAPALWRAYAKEFSGKDGSSKFIARMVETDADPKQVARWLWGTTAAGGGNMTSKHAVALKKLLGENSDAWGAVKQGMFETLIAPTNKGPLGPQALSNNIRSFFSSKKDSYKLAEVLFTPAERAELMKFSNAVRELVPPEGTVNFSNSAITMAMIAKDGAGAARMALRRAGDSVVPFGGDVAASAGGALSDMVLKRGEWLRAKAVAAGMIDDTIRPTAIVPSMLAVEELNRYRD